MDRAKVILIGGAPMSGKTSVARKLAARLGYCCLSTDDLGQAIRAVTTIESHPALHPMEGIDYREYYVTHSVEAIIADAEREHEAAWPAVEAVVQAHATWAAPAVIEGWALRPEWVAELGLPGVMSLWLIADEQMLEHRIRKETNFYQGSSDEDTMIRHFLARSLQYNKRVREAAERLQMPIVQPHGNAPTEEVFGMCLRMIES